MARDVDAVPPPLAPPKPSPPISQGDLLQLSADLSSANAHSLVATTVASTAAVRQHKRDVVFRELWPQILKPLRRTRYAKRFIKVAQSFGSGVDVEGFHRWNSVVGFKGDVKRAVQFVLAQSLLRSSKNEQEEYLRFLVEKAMNLDSLIKRFSLTIKMLDDYPGNPYHNNAYLTAQYILKLEYKRLHQTCEDRVNDFCSTFRFLEPGVISTEPYIFGNSPLEVHHLTHKHRTKDKVKHFLDGDVGMDSLEVATRILMVKDTINSNFGWQGDDQPPAILRSTLRRFERSVMTNTFTEQVDKFTKTTILQPRWVDTLYRFIPIRDSDMDSYMGDVHIDDFFDVHLDDIFDVHMDDFFADVYADEFVDFDDFHEFGSYDDNLLYDDDEWY
ncbi:hypothetical protein HDV05_001598 [Chytridiales sp. JEL 0842]|nr:hypothetical protein HDV05_001598 [Chytridiales sp. JEL 0842]